MEIESPEMHIEHFHKNPHPESPELKNMKEYFAAKKLEFTEHAKQYMNLDNRQLQDIINDCEIDKAKNDDLITKLRENKDFSEDENNAHIYQIQRAQYYLEHRKKTAELILDTRKLILTSGTDG